jgi:hypothetical protein
MNRDTCEAASWRLQGIDPDNPYKLLILMRMVSQLLSMTGMKYAGNVHYQNECEYKLGRYRDAIEKGQVDPQYTNDARKHTLETTKRLALALVNLPIASSTTSAQCATETINLTHK